MCPTDPSATESAARQVDGDAVQAIVHVLPAVRPAADQRLRRRRVADSGRHQYVDDRLRPRRQRLRAHTDRADDTELALGSDILSASLDGYALTKVFGKGTSLDTLKEAMKTRLSRKPRKPASPEA